VDSCLLLQQSSSVPKLPALGCYFMDHPRFELAIYDTGLDARPGYADSPQTGMLLTFFERVDEELPVSMLGEIRPVEFSLNAGQGTRDVLVKDLIRRALAAPDEGSFRDRFKQAWNGSLDIFFMVETQPVPENTVTIGRIETTGQVIPNVRLRYPEYFAECVRRVSDRVQARVPKAVVKHMSNYTSSFHWLGTTRMSTDDSVGCVDAQLRYHGLENLHVLSTSVFPSSSSANPTLTLAALALRLGDHLAKQP
jgi:choline dehydrogenase-like flavoprotein